MTGWPDSLLRPFLDDLDLLVGQAVEVIDEEIDLAVGRVDLALESSLLLVGPPNLIRPIPS